MPYTPNKVDESHLLTGRIKAHRRRETREETAAHMNRRIIKDLKESGGGRRNTKVGVYKIATYNIVMDVHATMAVVFDISLAILAFPNIYLSLASFNTQHDEDYY